MKIATRAPGYKKSKFPGYPLCLRAFVAINFILFLHGILFNVLIYKSELFEWA